MVATDLVRLFESLAPPPPGARENTLSAVPITAAGTHRLAKDASHAPCLLIRQRPHASRTAPIRLENLGVSFDVPCDISSEGRKQEQGTFTIVKCTSANPALHHHFLRIISPVAAALGDEPTHAAVTRSISGLVELFRSLSAPPTKTIQGVWGELLLIRRAADPGVLAAAWHREPGEHFDFSAGSQRIEVKSSSQRRREHHFSLEQLVAIGGARIVVASVFVEQLGGGMSLQRIADDVRASLADAEAVARFDSVFYKALGARWSDALDESFDWELAVESLAFFDAERVPRVENPHSAAVFDVRFRADIAAIEPLSAAHLDGLGGLFAAALPR